MQKDSFRQGVYKEGFDEKVIFHLSSESRKNLGRRRSGGRAFQAEETANAKSPCSEQRRAFGLMSEVRAGGPSHGTERTPLLGVKVSFVSEKAGSEQCSERSSVVNT